MSSFLLVLIFFNLEQKLFFLIKKVFQKKNDFRRLNTSVKIWIRFQLFKSNLFHGNYPNLSSIRALWTFWTQLKPFVFRFSLVFKINFKNNRYFIGHFWRPRSKIFAQIAIIAPDYIAFFQKSTTSDDTLSVAFQKYYSPLHLNNSPD